MRSARIKDEGPAFYHILSRVVDRRQVFDNGEKERFRKALRAVETFSDVHVLTYCLLDNHFHILLLVPARRPVSDEECVARVGILYDRTIAENLAEALRQRRADGQPEAAEALKAEYTYRMYDLSEFAKTLKQRVTQSYNRRHGRKGTLWEERFKSMMVQGKPGSLCAIAAYIDLNPVRAGVVADPKDYRFSGYGEAVAGIDQARKGLRDVISGGMLPWQQAAGEYRKYLYMAGVAKGLTPQGTALRKGFDPAKVQDAWSAGGALPLPELLRCRVRYFSDGVVLGSQAYVDEVFHRFRNRFGEKRATGARPMRGGFTDLFTARRLRLDVITVPAPG